MNTDGEITVITFLPDGVIASVIWDMRDALVSSRYGRLIVSSDAPKIALV